MDYELKKERDRIYSKRYKAKMKAKRALEKEKIENPIDKLVKRFNKVKEGARTKSETELLNGREHIYNILTV